MHHMFRGCIIILKNLKMAMIGIFWKDNLPRQPEQEIHRSKNMLKIQLRLEKYVGFCTWLNMLEK